MHLLSCHSPLLLSPHHPPNSEWRKGLWSEAARNGNWRHPWWFHAIREAHYLLWKLSKETKQIYRLLCYGQYLYNDQQIYMNKPIKNQTKPKHLKKKKERNPTAYMLFHIRDSLKILYNLRRNLQHFVILSFNETAENVLNWMISIQSTLSADTMNSIDGSSHNCHTDNILLCPKTLRWCCR